MRSQLLPLLQRGCGSGQQALSNAVTDLQVQFRLVAPSSCRALSAQAESAEAAEQATGAEALGQSAAAASSDGAAGSPQAADAAASAAAGSDSSSSTNTSGESSSRSSTSSSTSSSTAQNGSSGERQNSRLLQSMGLWVEPGKYQQLPQDMQKRLTRLRQTVPDLRHAPSGSMAVVNINTQNLQTVVLPAVHYRAGHPLLVVTEQQQQQQQQQQAGRSSKDSSSKGSSSAATAATSAPEQGQKRRQEPSRKETRGAVAAAAAPVLLSPESLMKENSSDLMVNLNAQMSNAFDAKEYVKVINLFDALLDQGMAAAQQLQQQQQQQQQEGAVEAAEQQQQQQQQQQLVLPMQYRPDMAALWTYCKALGRVSEQHVMRMRALKVSGDDERFNEARGRAQGLLTSAQRAVSLWAPARDAHHQHSKLGAAVHIAYLAACRAAGNHTEALRYWEEVRPRLQPDVLQRYWRLHLSAAVSALSLHRVDVNKVQDADRYARVFSDNSVVYRKEDYIHRIGPLYEQLVAHTAKAGLFDSALHWLQQLLYKDALLSVEPSNFLVVLQAAAAAGRMEYARVMMTALDEQLKTQGRLPYVYSEYQCIDLMAAGGRAGDVMFIEQVWKRLCADVTKPRSTSAQPRPAVDDDSELISAMTGTPHTPKAATTAADKADGTAPDAAAAAAESSSSSEVKGKRPSAQAHIEAIRAFVSCDAFGKAFEYIALLEGVVQGAADGAAGGGGDGASGGGVDPLCSVYQGLSFFPEALRNEAKLAAAYAQLQARKQSSQPVSTTMLNVLTRGVARLGSTDAIGKVFESYEGVWGLEPDADSYNAVLESCEGARKLSGVQGVMSLMSSRGVEPNTTSWNLLLSTAIRTGDTKAVASALNRMRTAGVDPSRRLLDLALNLALRQHDGKLRALLTNVVNEVVPNKSSNLHSRLKRVGGGGEGLGLTADRWDPQSDSSNGGSRFSSRGGSNDSSSSSSRNGGSRAHSSSSSWRSSTAVDSWRPGMPEGERRQQQQQQELSMVDEWVKPGNGGLSGSSSRAAGLRAMMDELQDK